MALLSDLYLEVIGQLREALAAQQLYLSVMASPAGTGEPLFPPHGCRGRVHLVEADLTRVALPVSSIRD